MSYLDPKMISQAKQVDLLTYLQNFEPSELVRISSGVHSTKSHDSLKISNGKWYWWSRDFGGKSALDYLIKVKGMSLPEAVLRIIGAAAIKTPESVKAKSESHKNAFTLPERNDSNDHLKEYLEGRGISPKITETLLNENRLFEEKYFHNVVFVGFNKDGDPKYALRRGTTEKRYFGEVFGSDKHFSFSLPSVEKSEALHVFESATDLLSFATIKLSNNGNYRDVHLLSLGGVFCQSKYSKLKLPVSLEQYLKDYAQIKKLYLHLDNDKAGKEASKALISMLKGTYEVTDKPPPYGKDFNDYLCFLTNKNNERKKDFMPNHVTNIITFKDVSEERLKEILENIKNNEEGIGSIDFNKIIPAPPEIYQGNLGPEEMEKYGENTWLSFNVRSWGTKWNAYQYSPYNEGESVIEFLTAWSPPEPILMQLSKLYPDAQLTHQWSDENFGYNVGERDYKNGEIIGENVPADGSKEAYEMASEIQGYELEEFGYKLSEDGTTYEYVEDKPEIENDKIKVILIRPMHEPEIVEIGSDLKSMQATVGGMIEAIYPYEEQVALVCNEEGKNLGLPLNRAIKDEDGEIADIIAGDFFIVDCSGENFGSLSDEQLEHYSEMFKSSEMFYENNGEIEAVPIMEQSSDER